MFSVFTNAIEGAFIFHLTVLTLVRVYFSHSTKMAAQFATQAKYGAAKGPEMVFVYTRSMRAALPLRNVTLNHSTAIISVDP